MTGNDDRHVLPDHTLLALYLAWRTARKGKTQAKISNDALKAYLRKQTVHKTQMEKFADKLHPVFSSFHPKQRGH
jgi:hypothetical protein